MLIAVMALTASAVVMASSVKNLQPRKPSLIPQPSPAVRTALAPQAAVRLPTHFVLQLARLGVPASSVSVHIAPLPPSLQPTPEAAAKASARGLLPRAAHQIDLPQNPASVMKVVTTLAALDVLGHDYTWHNRFETRGRVDASGTLQGDLLIRGSGDPKWVIERLQADIAALKTAGVRRIAGDVLLDNTAFDLPPANEADFDGDRLRTYNTLPDALLLNFKALTLTFTPDPERGVALISSEPPLAGVAIPISVPLTQTPCDAWREQLQADWNDASRVVLAGSYSAQCGVRTWSAAYTDPKSFAPRLLQAVFNAQGIEVQGQIRYATAPIPPNGLTLLHSGASLPLAQVVQDVNKFSNNVMAKQVFLTLGRHGAASVAPQGAAQNSAEIINNIATNPISASAKPVFATALPPATWGRAQQAVHTWWQARIAPWAAQAGWVATASDVMAPIIDNGSGLSRTERISAQSLAALLHWAAQSPHTAVFEASLPVAGVDGTMVNLAKRGIAPEAIGRARLKTGGLKDVASLAGFVDGVSGVRYSFVVLINHEDAGKTRPALDALVAWAVQDE